MATDIYKTKILNGIDADERNINRVVASSISQIHAQVNLLAELMPYLIDQSQIVDSGITSEYLTDVATKIQTQVAAREAYLPILTAIQQLFDADPAVQATGRAALDNFNAGKPAFETRYK